MTVHISDCRQFFVIHLSQGSVATYLRSCGIFECELFANLSLSLTMKEFENRLTFGEVMGKRLVVRIDIIWVNFEGLLQTSWPHKENKMLITWTVKRRAMAL